MASLKYKTQGSGGPQGKPRVYFCCHPADFAPYFEEIAEDILTKQNCAIWYRDSLSTFDGELENDLRQMQLFVIPVTANFLTTENEALTIEFPIAVQNNIPILPLMQEPGLEDLFNLKCGSLQFLNRHSADATEISYEEKLKKCLASVLVGDELAEKIRAAFDAYVFLSYRKKDRKYAQELMRLIHKNDFCRDIAIWYDEFLVPGENFNDSIRDALLKSELFVLTVTPNLINELNYIITTEYPMAKQENKPVFPVEFVPTDKSELFSRFAEIDVPVDAHDDAVFSDALLQAIKKLAIRENDGSPEHIFFIGLAYLNGIDVEVDRERAAALITSAAEKGLPEAMHKLYQMYTDGEGVAIDYNKAAYWAERSYADRLKTCGAQHPDTLDWLNNLALARGNTGDYQGQLELTQRCYDLHRQVFGEEHPETLTILHNLAFAHGELGEHEKALREQQNILNREYAAYTVLAQTDDAAIEDPSEHYKTRQELTEKCYALRKKVLGEEHPSTLRSLRELVDLALGTDRFRKKLELAERSYLLHRQALGEDHPDTMDALYIYTALQGDADSRGKPLRRLELEAELLALRKKQYALVKKIYGEDHTYTLDVLTWLADAYALASDYQKQTELMEICYGQRRKIFGDIHSSLLYPLSQLANSNLPYAKRIAAREQIYEINRHIYGETHDNTLLALHNLAGIYHFAEDRPNELRCREKMYVLRKDHLGEAHPVTLSFMQALAVAHINANDAATGLPILEKCYALRSRTLGETHLDTLISLRDLADAYGAAGDKTRELEARKKLYEVSCAVFGEENENTIAFLSKLAFLYGELNDRENTLEYMEKAYAVQQKFYGERDGRTIIALNNLAMSCADCGDYSKAVELFEKSDRLCRLDAASETLDTVRVLRSAARAYGQTGNDAKASEFRQKAMNLCRSIHTFCAENYGEKDLYALSALYQLALCHADCGDHAKYLELLEKCLALTKEVLGESHPDAVRLSGELRQAGLAEPGK